MQFVRHQFVTLSKAREAILKMIRANYTVAIDQLDEIGLRLDAFFSILIPDLKVIIESPYVDKVYRDSYYTYFSTKYKKYNRDAIRISFFDSMTRERDILDNLDKDLVSQYFLGYCVIRPTFPHIIGRNMLCKSALTDKDFETCIHKENIMLNGIKLHVEGFPHSSQDQESITCAETTVWAMMEYFGHKYAEYKPVLPSTIIGKLELYSDKRMLPSEGLTTEQISFVLKDFGFGTMIYSNEQDTDFLANLSVYIESGFPVIPILQDKDFAYGHATLIIGREKFATEKLMEAFQGLDRSRKIIPFSSLVKQYIVQDDNLPPYAAMPLDAPGIHYKKGTPEYTYTIKAFVVPLYRKMYMEVRKARQFFNAIITDPDYGIRVRQPLILRMYMASSRSLKAHIAEQERIDPVHRKILLSSAMPRFVWCAEYINKKDASKRCVSSLIVLDATEAGEIWQESFIFAAHKKVTRFYVAVNNTYELIPLEYPLKEFAMFEHNLN